jgi:hypothetical protein
MFEFMTLNDGLNAVRFSFPSVEDCDVVKNIVWLDLECDKVKAPAGWAYSTRTRAFMVGLGFYTPGEFVIEVVTGEEEAVMDYVRVMCEDCEVRYCATKSYDKLVVEGRWTYARRGPSAVPGNWPNVNGLNWKNIRTEAKRDLGLIRSFDIASKDVPAEWPEACDTIILHNVRDVLLMVVEDFASLPFDFDFEIVYEETEKALDCLVGYRV